MGIVFNFSQMFAFMTNFNFVFDLGDFFCW
jgi:hypothetical protein